LKKIKVPVTISLINQPGSCGFIQIDDKIKPSDQQMPTENGFNLLRINHYSPREVFAAFQQVDDHQQKNSGLDFYEVIIYHRGR